MSRYTKRLSCFRYRVFGIGVFAESEIDCTNYVYWGVWSIWYARCRMWIMEISRCVAIWIRAFSHSIWSVRFRPVVSAQPFRGVVVPAHLWIARCTMHFTLSALSQLAQLHNSLSAINCTQLTHNSQVTMHFICDIEYALSTHSLNTIIMYLIGYVNCLLYTHSHSLTPSHTQCNWLHTINYGDYTRWKRWRLYPMKKVDLIPDVSYIICNVCILHTFSLSSHSLTHSHTLTLTLSHYT